MSKLFFDHLIVLDEVEKQIKQSAQTQEEREELYKIVDEIVHHRVLGCIFDFLPDEYHHDFMDKFHDTPYDESLLDYINEKVKDKLEEKIEERIKKETSTLAKEILEAIKDQAT